MRGACTGKLKRQVATALACLLPAVALGQASELDAGVRPRAPGGEAGAISTSVSDPIALPREGPIVVSYADSPKLTAMLREALKAEGLRVGEEAPRATVVRVRGVLQLTGKHTARIPIAELAERGTLVDVADAHRTLVPADVAYVIATGTWLNRLVDAGQLSAPAAGVLLLDVVGQATGAKDWFNKAVGGDRRGVCLLNCENWQKTRQAALHVVELGAGEGRRRMEVKSELFAEALQPGAVVSAGLEALIAALSGKNPSGEAVLRTRNGIAPN
jgi:hypothetical protein